MKNILLVDDEIPIKVLTKKMLEKKDYKVYLAGNGNECLDFLKKERPDLILLDVMMPGENGWDVCKKIKGDEKTKDIPVVIFTVKSPKEEPEKMEECGCEGYLRKPFSSADLFNTLEQHLK